MSEHAWFDEHLAGYHAGGLTAEERERFERHAAGCKDCARALNDWAGFDRSLDDLFAEVRPEVGWEGRLLQGLRTAPPPRRLRWTRGFSIAAAIAALVLLGVIGAILQRFVEDGSLSFPGLRAEGPTHAANELKQLSVAIQSFKGRPRIDMVVDESGSMEAGGELLPSQRAWAFSPDGRQVATGDGSVRDVHLWRADNALKGFEDIDGSISGKSEKFFEPSRIHTSTEGGLIGGKQKRREPAIVEGKDRGLAGMDGEGREVDKKSISDTTKRMEKMEHFLGATARTPETSFGFGIDPVAKEDSKAETRTGASNKTGFGAGGGSAAEKTPTKTGPGDEAPVNFPPGAPPKTGTGETAYFKPAESKVSEKVVKVNPSEKPKYTVTSGKPQKKEVDSEVSAGEKGKPPAGGRKIVRTGNVDYEVVSFDDSVKRIKQLINLVEGGIFDTENSEKLANGKMKGSVVVRMPPEKLDQFLVDLRKELGKAGDLKSMRVGSQDITKQYTDVESRLKAAKTMEERLLQIIKTGKGEIKDLVVAEEKLGIVRTKIEEMEGDIRYYNNQVSLSKLTIGLTEKEIQAASALEITEKIKMRIEVEEVEKAQGTILEGVKKATGRIIKSDLKLHGAGQLEAIMIFEVKPAQVPELRKVLKQIGNITKDEAERQQTAVGGTEPAGNIKPQVKDTNFEVRLYNLANIQPRETLTLTVATRDVPGSYKKLQDAVKGKGQVRRGQFNEQDKLNISAIFDFDLNVKDRAGIDKVLAEVGKEIGRSTEQAQPSDNVTDQKIGYRLTLRSVASIPPREKITLAIEVKNVEQTTNEMVDAVKSHKEGLVATGPLYSLDPNGQVRAVILFDVPFAAKDELVKQFKSTGTVRVQQTSPNPKVPENELATAHIDVALSSVGPIVPSDDSLGPQIRKSLFYSFKIFSISLSFVLLGILGILPPVLVLLVLYKLLRKWRQTSNVKSSMPKANP